MVLTRERNGGRLAFLSKTREGTCGISGGDRFLQGEPLSKRTGRLKGSLRPKEFGIPARRGGDIAQS